MIKTLRTVTIAAILLVAGTASHLVVRAEEPPTARPTQPTGRFSFVKDRHDDEQLDLGGKSVWARVTESAGGKWLLPVYLIDSITLPKAGDANPVATVVLRDALYDGELEKKVGAAMDAKFGKAWNKALPAGNAVDVSLVLSEGKWKTRFGTADFERKPGKRDHTLEFKLTTEDAARLLATDRTNLGLSVEEHYAGTFDETDLKATVSVAQSAATNFKNKLGKTADGKEAMLLVAVGGGVSNKVGVQQLLGRDIRMELLTAKDKPVNQPLIDSLLAKLFDGVKAEVELAKQKDDAVVTFVGNNGLKATAAIGVVKGMKDQWKKDRDNLLKTATMRKGRERDKLVAEAKASGLFGLASAELKFEKENEREHESKDEFEQQVKTVDEVMKALDGEFPTACLSAEQVQKVVSNTSSVTQVSIGSFAEGQKRIASEVSFAEHILAWPKLQEERDRHLRAIRELTKKRDALLFELLPLAKGLKEKDARYGQLLPQVGQHHAEAVRLKAELWASGGARGWAEHLSNVWKDPKYKNVHAEHMRAKDDAGVYPTRNDRVAAYEKQYGTAEASLGIALKELESLAPNHTRLAELASQLDETDKAIAKHTSALLSLLGQ